MKEIQVTLYEIFGYLLPGVVLCTALGFWFWALFFPQSAIEFDLKTVEVWGTLLVLAYIGGHVTQSVGNQVCRLFTSPEEHAVKKLPTEFVKACREKVAKILESCNREPDRAKEEQQEDKNSKTKSDEVNELSPLWLYRFCDDAVLRSGKVGEREVYTYREGFNRGTAIALLLLFTSLLAFSVRLWFFSNDGLARIGFVEIDGRRVVFFALVAAIACVWVWLRFWRFAEYRITHAMIGFLTLKDKSDEKAGDGKSSGESK